MRIVVSMTLLLFEVMTAAHAVPLSEKQDRPSDVYEIQDAGQKTRFIAPKPEKPTLREIVYYHLIEKPYEEAKVERKSEPAQIEMDESLRPFTNGHGYQFADYGLHETENHEESASESEHANDENAVEVSEAAADKPVFDEKREIASSDVTVITESPITKALDEKENKIRQRQFLFDRLRERYIASLMKTSTTKEPEIISTNEAIVSSTDAPAIVNLTKKEEISNTASPLPESDPVERVKRSLNYQDIPIAPTLPPIDYNKYPGLRVFREPADGTDNQDSKFKMNDIFATSKPNDDDFKNKTESRLKSDSDDDTAFIPQTAVKTYGMNLSDDHGYVWNNMFRPINYQVGAPMTLHEDNQDVVISTPQTDESSTEGILTSSEEMIHSTGEISTPNDEILKVTEENFTPNEEIVTPTEGILPSSGEELPSAEEDLTPSDEILTRIEDMFKPTEVILKPTEEILTSSDEIFTSTESILTSSEGILTSSEGIVTSKEEILTPTEEILTSSDEILSSTDKIFTSTEGTETSSELIETSAEGIETSSEGTLTSTEDIATSKEDLTPIEETSKSGEEILTSTESVETSTVEIFAPIEETSKSGEEILTSTEGVETSTVEIFAPIEETSKSGEEILTSTEGIERSTVEIFAPIEDTSKSGEEILTSTEGVETSTVEIFAPIEETSTTSDEILTSTEEIEIQETTTAENNPEDLDDIYVDTNKGETSTAKALEDSNADSEKQNTTEQPDDVSEKGEPTSVMKEDTEKSIDDAEKGSDVDNENIAAKSLLKHNKRPSKDKPVEEKEDLYEKLIKSEQFWKWLAHWTSNYMEVLSQRVKEMVKQEVAKEIKKYENTNHDIHVNQTKEENKINETENKEPVIKNNTIIIDGNEIPITNTSNLEGNVTLNEDFSRKYRDRDDKPNHRKSNVTKLENNKLNSTKLESNKLNETSFEIDKTVNKEVQPNVTKAEENHNNVKANNIYGSSTGNDHVTNIFIFYPKTEAGKIIDSLKPYLNDSNIGIETDAKDQNENEKKDEETTTSIIIPVNNAEKPDENDKDNTEDNENTTETNKGPISNSSEHIATDVVDADLHTEESVIDEEKNANEGLDNEEITSSTTEIPKSAEAEGTNSESEPNNDDNASESSELPTSTETNSNISEISSPAPPDISNEENVQSTISSADSTTSVSNEDFIAL